MPKHFEMRAKRTYHKFKIRANVLNGTLYVAYEQEIYALLTLRFHKFEKTQSVKFGSI
ncbi:hypothetical protein MSIBF_A3100001 [groundwater metagenome]|uniref:Uncharacterized protein n=1 Tax=groundwater metagenome TaxID=717931 RepID=A0A098EDB6_9ZZZZ